MAQAKVYARPKFLSIFPEAPAGTFQDMIVPGSISYESNR